MGILKSIIENSKSKNRRLKEAQEEQTIMKKLHERNLGHNERELNSILERERQIGIKKDLKFFDLQRKINEKTNARNMMSFNPEIWSDNHSILKW